MLILSKVYIYFQKLPVERWSLEELNRQIQTIPDQCSWCW